MNPPTDEELLLRIARGDEGCLGLLYDRYGRLAFSLAFRIVGDGGNAEDVVQEAFLKIWRRAPSYDPARGHPRTWLLSIVHHQAIDIVRGQRGLPPASYDEEANNLLSGSEDVWQSVSARLDHQAIVRALAVLPKEQRQTIELAFFGGYTHREIAKKLQAPLGTVKGRIRIGMEKLKVLLMDHQVELT